MSLSLVGFLIIENAANALMGAVVMQKRKLAKRKAALGKWDIGPEPTPVIDPILRRCAGYAETPAEKKQVAFFTSAVRNIVNRKAFDHVVAGLLHRNSRLRRMLPALTKAREGKVFAGFREARRVYRGI